MSEEKGTFVVAGEKAQRAADFSAAKLLDAKTYVVEKATEAGAYVSATACTAKDSILSASHNAEHSAADGLRSAADKIDSA